MKNILIVDDEKPFLASVQDGLAAQARNYGVLTAYNGQQALEILGSTKIDLLVTDLKMPVMDGFELLAHVSRSHPGIPSVIMTAFGTPEIEERLRRIDSCQFLEKPLDIDVLDTTIARGLAADPKSYIRGINLATFLQLVQMERKTCTLKIRSKKGVGFLYIRAGELLAAETETLSGVAAAHEIVCWPEPEIEMEGGCGKNSVSIDTSIEYLLLEAFRIEDERKRTASEQFSHEVSGAVPGPAGNLPGPLALESTPEPVEALAASTGGTEHRGDNQMNKMMEEIKALPGVVGGFVMDDGKGLLVNNLPSFFKEARLLEVGKKLQKIYRAGLPNFPDSAEVSLFYAESVLIIRPVEGLQFLILVCDPAVNINMLSMSLNLALESLAGKEAAEAFEVADSPQATSPATVLEPGYVLLGPLGGPLRKIEAALVQIMGPMGALIFEDALDRWCAGGLVSTESLPQLVQLVAEEIGDAKKRQDFAHLLPKMVQGV